MSDASPTGPHPHEARARALADALGGAELVSKATSEGKDHPVAWGFFVPDPLPPDADPVAAYADDAPPRDGTVVAASIAADVVLALRTTDERALSCAILLREIARTATAPLRIGAVVHAAALPMVSDVSLGALPSRYEVVDVATLGPRLAGLAEAAREGVVGLRPAAGLTLAAASDVALVERVVARMARIRELGAGDILLEADRKTLARTVARLRADGLRDEELGLGAAAAEEIARLPR